MNIKEHSTKGTDIEVVAGQPVQLELFRLTSAHLTNAFGRAIEKKKSLKQMSEGSGLLKFHYKKPLAQLQVLLDFIS